MQSRAEHLLLILLRGRQHHACYQPAASEQNRGPFQEAPLLKHSSHRDFGVCQCMSVKDRKRKTKNSVLEIAFT